MFSFVYAISMRLHRFYINTLPTGKTFTIAHAGLIHQWRNVFRLRAGDSIIIFSGDGNEYECAFSALEKQSARLSVKKQRPALMRRRVVTLFPALIKKDKLEWIFQKATEIGIARFVPILTERSEKRSFNRERSCKILIEATEQSGWGTVPVLEQTITLHEALARPDCLAALDGRGMPLDPAYALKTSGILIGPEGGFSDAEIERFRARGIPIYSLGPSTLRAETAAIVAATKLML